MVAVGLASIAYQTTIGQAEGLFIEYFAAALHAAVQNRFIAQIDQQLTFKISYQNGVEAFLID